MNIVIRNLNLQNRKYVEIDYNFCWFIFIKNMFNILLIIIRYNLMQQKCTITQQFPFWFWLTWYKYGRNVDAHTIDELWRLVVVACLDGLYDQMETLWLFSFMLKIGKEKKEIFIYVFLRLKEKKGKRMKENKFLMFSSRKESKEKMSLLPIYLYLFHSRMQLMGICVIL